MDCIPLLGISLATIQSQHLSGTGQGPEESLIRREWVRKLESIEAEEIRKEFFPNCAYNKPNILYPELSLGLNRPLS